MPFNGAGAYTPPSSDFPAVANTLIESTKFNNVINDIATALSNCMTRDGQSPATANIPFGNFKATGLAVGTARTDAATLGQLQDGAAQWAGNAGGTADALTLTLAPAITAYAAPQLAYFKATATNTGAATVAINGLTTKAIQKNGAALAAGDITNGRWYALLYDGTAFQLSDLSPVPKALGTTKGDMVVWTAANTPARKAVPSNGYVRVADSAQTDGWQDVPFSRKNAIINGAFNIKQRGSAGTGITDGTFVADRFFWSTAGAGVFDSNSASTDVPTVAEAGRLFNYSLLIDCTTADGALAAGDVYGVGYIIEGYDWAHFAQRAFTLSFWVKSTKIGTFCVGFTNGGLDRSYVAEYTVNVTNTWEKKTITVTASPSAGTWDYVAGGGLRIVWTIAAGSTFHASAAGAWENGNFIATANQVNGADSNTNDFRITGVQLEAGSFATEFEYRDFATELALCQRYYEKSYDIGTALASVTTVGSYEFRNIESGSSNNVWTIPFKTRKREVPTITFYNSTTGGTTTWRGSTGANLAVSAENTSESSFAASVTPGSFEYVNGHWTADAEI